ncbi:MAG: hypothetical protein HY508_13770 [Acidobacteria bacterium]|nr:hypothetical protein [Acidobacteriota bacterium]
MPSVSSEIISDITNHISRFGGDFSAWWVGTARDWHSPVLGAHEQEEKYDDFICREAYAPPDGADLAFQVCAPKAQGAR